VQLLDSGGASSHTVDGMIFVKVYYSYGNRTGLDQVSSIVRLRCWFICCCFGVIYIGVQQFGKGEPVLSDSLSNSIKNLFAFTPQVIVIFSTQWFIDVGFKSNFFHGYFFLPIILKHVLQTIFLGKSRIFLNV